MCNENDGPETCPKCNCVVEEWSNDELYCPCCGWHSGNPDEEDEEKEESLEEVFGMDEDVVRTNIYHN